MSVDFWVGKAVDMSVLHDYTFILKRLEDLCLMDEGMKGLDLTSNPDSMNFSSGLPSSCTRKSCYKKASQSVSPIGFCCGQSSD